MQCQKLQLQKNSSLIATFVILSRLTGKNILLCDVEHYILDGKIVGDGYDADRILVVGH